jgi:hypothetical protein
MPIKKHLLFNLLWLNMLPLSAQINDLLKNKDITWVAEISTDLIVDNPDSAYEKGLNSVRTIKLLPNPLVSGIDDHLEFSYIIHDAIKSEKITFYSDSICQKRVFFKDVSRLDTLIVCFQQFYDDKVHTYTSFHQPEDFYSFRVRQVVFYDAKRIQFGLRTIAFAPLVNKRNDDGDIIGSYPVCWIKTKDIKKRPRLSSDDITWARTLVPKGGFDIKKAKILKQVSDDMPMIHFLNVAEKDSTKTFFNAESITNMKKIPFKDLSLIFLRLDTLTADISGLHGGGVIENRLNKSEINRLRLVQEWFWDDRKHALSIRLVAVTPIKEITNEADEFLYYKPLFHRRLDTN